MRSFIYLLSALLFLLPASKIFATHYYGIDLYYTHISGNNYKVTLVAFGDCSGAAFPSFSTTRPRVYVKDGSNTVFDAFLELEAPTNGLEVTEGCPADLDKSNCKDPMGTTPGVKKFVYSRNFILPYKSANWKFVYQGETNATTVAGRSSGLTNISPVGVISLEATLNNTVQNNSSPQFNSVATKFYCINAPEQYDLGATDTDGDSLVYELVPGIDVSVPVSYLPGYSGSSPVAATAGTFNFNSNTSLLSFTPNQLQMSLVVYRVSEYRNGVLIGTVMREMTIIVLPCIRTPPFGFISSAVGAAIVDSVTVQTCVGKHLVSFNINPVDSQGNNISMVATNLPTGSTIDITNNNTGSPTSRFEWNMPDLPEGDYSFYINYTDDGCPPTSDTQRYTIRIKPDDIKAQALTATCSTKGYMLITAPLGWAPWQYDLYQDNNLVYSTYRIIANVHRDSIASGRYKLFAMNDLGCKSDAILDVPSSCNIAGLPTAFTPNGDGENDILYVRGENIKEIHLKIYNRWGEVVFESNHINIGWDGKHNGVDASIEAYAYVLSVLFNDGESYYKQGNVTILK